MQPPATWRTTRWAHATTACSSQNQLAQSGGTSTGVARRTARRCTICCSASGAVQAPRIHWIYLRAVLGERAAAVKGWVVVQETSRAAAVCIAQLAVKRAIGSTDARSGPDEAQLWQELNGRSRKPAHRLPQAHCSFRQLFCLHRHPRGPVCKSCKPISHAPAPTTMALLTASPVQAPFAPTRSIRGTTRASRQAATAAQQQQRRQPASAAAARQAATAAAALASSLAASPAALAAADHAAAAASADPQVAQLVADLALLDAQSAGLLSAILKPTLSLASLLMIVRIVMSWYPELDGKQMPWTIAYTPTGE